MEEINEIQSYIVNGYVLKPKQNITKLFRKKGN